MFIHIVEAMRAHEATESSSLDIKLITHADSEITIEALNGTYETQGRFQNKKKQRKTRKNKKNKNRKNKKRGMYMRLVDHGSIEGRLEASHMINENLQAEVDLMRQVQQRQVPPPLR